MALWHLRPERQVLIHSEHACQFTGHEWQAFLAQHQMLCSMSRRGNCHDNAVAENFIHLLKRERVRRQIYATCEDARSDVFNHTEMFNNPTRRHSNNDGLSPAALEQRHSHGLKGVYSAAAASG